MTVGSAGSANSPGVSLRSRRCRRPKRATSARKTRRPCHTKATHSQRGPAVGGRNQSGADTAQHGVCLSPGSAVAAGRSAWRGSRPAWRQLVEAVQQ